MTFKETRPDLESIKQRVTTLEGVQNTVGQIGFIYANATLSENNQLIIPIQRIYATGGTATCDLTITGVTSGVDYTSSPASGSTITFTSGSDRQEIIFNALAISSDQTATITLSNFTGANAGSQVTLTISLVNSTTGPVISLVGANPLNINWNSTYIEPGYSATDAEDGPLSVTVVGVIDTSAVGTYSLDYIATDSDLNETTVTRVVNVNSIAPTFAPSYTLPDVSVDINGEVNFNLSNYVTSNGGDSNLTYAVASGSLPTGVTLNASTGIVSGTATSAVNNTVTYSVTNSSSDSATISHNMEVRAAASALDFIVSSINVTEGDQFYIDVRRTGDTTNSDSQTLTIPAGSSYISLQTDTVTFNAGESGIKQYGPYNTTANDNTAGAGETVTATLTGGASVDIVIADAGLSSGWIKKGTFENVSVGVQSTTSDGFGSWASVVGSTDQANSGTKSLKASITTGSTGNGWGGREPPTTVLTEGDEIWYRWYFFFPTGFDFTTDSGGLKLMRMHVTNSSGQHVGYHTLRINSNGIGVINEINGPLFTANHGANRSGLGPGPVMNQWFRVEWYIKFSATAGNAKYRVWQDNTLVFDDDGLTNTLRASSDKMINTYFLTHWNGGSPATQSMYLDDVYMTNATPAQTDGSGNAFIGTTSSS